MRSLVLLLGVLLLTASAALAQAPAAADGLQKVVLQLKWKHQFQFAGYYAAIEKGYYRDVGLEVELLQRLGPQGPVETVLSGTAQYGIESISVVRERLNGKPLIALAAIFQHSPSVLLAEKNKNIRTAKDLNGRRIMANPFNDEEFKAMLLKEGLALESIDWVPRPPASKTDDLLLKENRDVDALNVYLTNGPFYFQQQKQAYDIINPVDYGIDFYSDFLFTTEQELIENPQRVAAFRQASLRGWNYALEHPDEIIELILSRYAAQKSREHLKFEAAETAKLIRKDVVAVGHINPGRVAHMADVLKQLGRVASTAGLAGLVYDEQAAGQLSVDELRWLQSRPRVRVAAGHVPPLMYERDGGYEGILVDYLELLVREYGLQIEYQPVSWSQALQGLGTPSGPDLIPALRESADRRHIIAFSEPFLSLPTVIFTRDEDRILSDVNDLIGRKVAIPRDYLLSDYLRKNHPGIILIEVPGYREALRRLANGEVDATIESLVLGSHAVKAMGLENIKVAAPAPLLTDQHVIGVRRDWPELVSLIDRVFAQLTPQQHSEIRNRWLSVRYEHVVSKDALFFWGGWGIAIFLLSSGFFLFWNRSLAKEVNRRRTTEHQLLDSVLQFQRLVQTVPHGILELDGDGKIVFCNESAALLLQCQTHDLHGEHFARLIIDEAERQRFSRQILHPPSQAVSYSQVLKLKGKAGAQVVAQVDFNMDETEPEKSTKIISITDLTARRDIEQALQESERVYASTFAMVQAGVAHVSLDGRFLKANPFLCELLGYTEQELRRLTFSELTHPDDREQSAEMVKSLLAGQQDYFSLEKRYLKQDGSVTWGLASVSLLQGPPAEARFLVVVQDINAIRQRQLEITEQALLLETLIEQRTEELQRRVIEVESLNQAMLNLAEDLQASHADLKRKNTEIAEVNKELEAFAYSISHDLRAPLRHIQAFADILLRNAAPELSAENLGCLKKVLSSAARLGEMIENLLEFSRAGRSELQLHTVNVDLLVREVIAGLGETLGERQIAWQIAELPKVQADTVALRQVFVNLLSNAVKYTLPRDPAQITVDCEQEADRLIFRVADNGVGFDPQQSHKLFGVFSRLHRQDQFDGVGIGLANVKQIVKRHGGQVWAAAEVDRGAQFFFSLPCKQESAKEVLADSQVAG